MKNLKNKIVAFCLGGSLLLSGTACSDWLELEPENSVTAGKYWQTREDVANAMTGIYCSLVNATDRMFMQGEMRADYLAPGPADDGSYVALHRGDITSSNSWVAWAEYYSVINNCNLLLEKAGEALKNDPSFTMRDYNIFMAEATTIRAFMYFYLIRSYKDVPYVTWAYFDDLTERNCATTAQYDILKDQLAQLETILKEDALPGAYNAFNPHSAENKGQVTVYFLQTLMADMYRWLGALESDPAAALAANQRCVELCDNVINSGIFSLVDVQKNEPELETLEEAVVAADSAFYMYVEDYAIAKMFDSIYVDGNSRESIFELQITEKNVSPFYSMFVASSRKYMPNNEHIRDNIFLSTENVHAQKGNYADIRYRINCVGAGELKYIWKYSSNGFENGMSGYYASADEYIRNFVVYRLAEVYLMKAEALTQVAWANGDDQVALLEAYQSVYKVRNRASAVETTDVLLDNGVAFQTQFWNQLKNGEEISLEGRYTLSAQNMESFILDEQGREMAFEGRRWFDVIRHTVRNDYGKGSGVGGDFNYLLNIVSASTTVDKANYLRTAYQNYESHYLPYPYQDVKFNELLTQKPFYGIE